MIFTDKVVLIVGASRGMGRGVALRVAAEGATIVATARSEAGLQSLAAAIVRQGGRCAIHPADARDAAAAVVACTAGQPARD